jgi:hypothetical protein
MNLVFIRRYLNALHQTRDLNETATKETELPTRRPRLSVGAAPHLTTHHHYYLMLRNAQLERVFVLIFEEMIWIEYKWNHIKPLYKLHTF